MCRRSRKTLPGYETIGWIRRGRAESNTRSARAAPEPGNRERPAVAGRERAARRGWLGNGGQHAAEFDRHMASEVARFRKVIRDAGIKRE